MRVSSSGTFASNEFVTLKDQNWLDKQRVAGKIAAGALLLLEQQIKNNTDLSLIELNNLAEQYIQDHHCSLTFKGYKGFPAGVCISVNKQLVHGIPTDYHLKDGDLISFDLGTTYQGAIADTAITCIYGMPKSERHRLLVQATEECLMAGIKAIEVGKKLGVIGNAISNVNKKYGFGLVTKYGGHGLCTTKDGVGIPHAPPFIANKASVNEGIRIQPGLVIAIEPMLIIGDTYTFVEKDGWTVCGMGISAHFEHSLYVHEDHVEIISQR
jgi:methionyl aminopeptidase